jgi:hypothetical protein
MSKEQLCESMKARIYQEGGCVEQFKRLWEIYYYLLYGLNQRAWEKIWELKEEHRWKIPSNVFHFLEKNN